MIKVAIITNVIPNYRRDFYERLGNQQEFDITIFCQQKIPGTGIVSIHKELKVNSHEVKCWCLNSEKLAWQWIPAKKLFKGFDIYVFYGNPRVLSNVLWATLLKILGRKVAIWGQAHTSGSSSIFQAIRYTWWKLFDFLLVYNDKEANELINSFRNNKTIIGMNNGLDQKKIDDEITYWNEPRIKQWENRQGLENKIVLLSCARLEKKNKFHLLIQCLPDLIAKHKNLVWCVIGDGSLKEDLKTQSRQLSLENNIHFTGAIYEEHELAPWFITSSIFIHPGAIGLSLMHAFGYGLPVITHDNISNHMPEITAFENGKTGLLYEEDNVESFKNTILHLLDSHSLQDTMRSKTQLIAKESYNTKIMAQRFSKLINLMSKT